MSSVDTNISLGNVLTIISIVVAVGASWVSLSSSIARLEERQKSVEERLILYDKDHDTIIELQGQIRDLSPRLDKR